MAEEKKTEPIERMVAAYERMLARADEMMQRAEQSTIPTLRKALEQARDKAVEFNELTREEAEKLSEYVERDMRDAAHLLAETGEELRQWWRFDVELIEHKLMELFANVADKTRLELEQLAEQAREASYYHTGEVTGPGTLVCTACGEELHFTKAGHIPPCPACQGKRYQRQVD